MHLDSHETMITITKESILTSFSFVTVAEVFFHQVFTIQTVALSLFV